MSLTKADCLGKPSLNTVDVSTATGWCFHDFVTDSINCVITSKLRFCSQAFWNLIHSVMHFYQERACILPIPEDTATARQINIIRRNPFSNLSIMTMPSTFASGLVGGHFSAESKHGPLWGKERPRRSLRGAQRDRRVAMSTLLTTHHWEPVLRVYNMGNLASQTANLVSIWWANMSATMAS
eukprot:g79915.t1